MEASELKPAAITPQLHIAAQQRALQRRPCRIAVAMKSFVGITMLFTQSFYLLHLAIVFFRSGKKLEQPCLEQFICLKGFLEKFPAAHA
jgi:hypothetical protein